MEQIKSFERISSLISSCMKKGVKTNNFLTAADYEADIASGSLFCHTWPGGLLVLRRRKGYNRLYFHIFEPYRPPEIEINELTVLELPMRPDDAEGGLLSEYWKNAGFKVRLNRIRLQRSEAQPFPEISEDREIRKPQPPDLEALVKLYEGCFDRYTGCIPNMEELRAIVDGGNIFCALAPDKSIGGFIQFTPYPNSRIRHLAVREDLRGKGISKA